jgi:hypothetical protein
MADDHWLAIWRISAPLEQVYVVIRNSLCWPDWWPGVQQGRAGGSRGCRWHQQCPALRLERDVYRMVFEVRTTRIENLEVIKGTAEGDLEGIGRWHFARQGALSVVRYELHVRSTRWWMNLIAPFARSLFIRNHTRIMAQGAEGLARRLGATLVSQESIDLMADTVPSRGAV